VRMYSSLSRGFNFSLDAEIKLKDYFVIASEESFRNLKNGITAEKLIRNFKKSFVCFVILYGVVCFVACTDPKTDCDPDYLIKTSSLNVGSEAFLEELDLKKAAYPYTIRDNPAEYNEMVIHLVKMLSEEIVLLSAAEKKGISVTNHELQLAEDEFKKDYPDDSFEQILLRSAISYPFWKKRFKKNMIIDKLIDQELKKKVEITARDIVEFYNQSRRINSESADAGAMVLKKIEDEKELVSRLRMQKTQEQYDEWIQALKNDHPVEINKGKLRTFLIDIEKSGESDDGEEN